MADNKKPPIPALSRDVPVEIRRAFDALGIYLANLKTEAAPVEGDGGGTVIVQPGGGGGTPTFTIDPPTTPTGVVATGLYESIMITWDPPAYRGHAFAEVFRSSTNQYQDAIIIGTAAGSMYLDTPPRDQLGRTYYYWIRFVNMLGVIGPIHSLTPVQASTATDPAYLMTLLQNQLGYEQFNFVEGVFPVRTWPPFNSGLPNDAPLPALPDTVWPQGSVIYRLLDGKLYRQTPDGTQWTASLSAGDIAGTLTASNFAAGLEPVSVVSALPNPAGYTGPKVVLLTTDRKIYRYTGSAWTKVVPTTDLQGKIQAAQIDTGQITADHLAANSVTAGKIAAGAISADKIQAGILTLRRAPKILIARKSTSYAGTPAADAALKALGGGMTVTTTLNASLTTCRNYDIIVIDCDQYGADEHAAFIKSLWEDGQRVWVVGTRSTNVLWYILTTSTEMSSVGAPAPLSIAHPVCHGWGPLSTTTQNPGYRINTLATTIGTKALSSYNAISETPNPSGGVVIHMQAPNFSWVEDPAKVQPLFWAIINYLTGPAWRTSIGQITAANSGTVIAPGAITSGLIAANAITADKIEAGAINAGHIAAGAITSSEIGTNTIIANEANIGAGVLTSAKIGTIGADKIAAGTITNYLTIIGSLMRSSDSKIILDTANKFLKIEGSDGRYATLNDGDLTFRLATGQLYKSVRRIIVGEAVNGDTITFAPGFYTPPLVIVGIKDGLLYDGTNFQVSQSFEVKAHTITATSFKIAIFHKKSSAKTTQAVNITYGWENYNGATVYGTNYINSNLSAHRFEIKFTGGVKYYRNYISFIGGPFYSRAWYRVSWRPYGSTGAFTSVGMCGAVPDHGGSTEFGVGAYAQRIEVKVEYMGAEALPTWKINEVYATHSWQSIEQLTAQPTAADAVATYMAIEGGVGG